jgi:hypothetical protein
MESEWREYKTEYTVSSERSLQAKRFSSSQCKIASTLEQRQGLAMT